MTVYLLHFDRRYKHAGHYLGSAKDLQARLDHHANGTGANLLRVIKEAGIGWQLARTWEGGRDKERQLKKQIGASRFCPICKAEKRAREKGEEMAEQETEASDVGGFDPTPYDMGAAEDPDMTWEQFRTALPAAPDRELEAG
jgi:predicted GIY-YIG superfamily endonuclease